METDDDLLNRFHTLTDQERQDLEARIEACYQARIHGMSGAERQQLANELQAVLEKYQG